MQSEAISKCDHHCESIYREMTKQLLPHHCRDGGSPCLSRLSSPGAAPSPRSSARSRALLPSPAQLGAARGSGEPRAAGQGWSRWGRDGAGGERMEPAGKGWSRRGKNGAGCSREGEPSEAGEGRCELTALLNGVVKYTPEPTLHANVPRGR